MQKGLHAPQVCLALGQPVVGQSVPQSYYLRLRHELVGHVQERPQVKQGCSEQSGRGSFIRSGLLDDATTIDEYQN
jgi:hypothetical protein